MGAGPAAGGAAGVSCRRGFGHGLKAEGAPGFIKAVWVGEADVAPSGAVLGMAGLHPEDVLRDASLGGDSEASHAAEDPGEGH
jgi:hypothetical protein